MTAAEPTGRLGATRFRAATLAVGLLVVAMAQPSPGVEVELRPYNGWPDAVDIQNDEVRLVVVPAIGRILHYGWRNGENLLYVNPSLDGVVLAKGEVYKSDGEPTHAAFGGDRVWTTSEELFVEIRGKRNLPDHWTDGSPNTFRPLADGVVIETPVSKLLGVSVRREVRLAPHGSAVRIAQTLTKVRPAANEYLDTLPLTIWNLTKLHSIRQTWLPLASPSVFQHGYYVPSWSLYRVRGNYRIENGLLRLTPQTRNGQKVGNDSSGWVAGWTGETLVMERFEYIEDETYPDGGTSAAVYTNPKFTELECLSPERVLAVGESIAHEIQWELHRAASEAEAEKVLRALVE